VGSKRIVDTDVIYEVTETSAAGLRLPVVCSSSKTVFMAKYKFSFKFEVLCFEKSF
jgi:hypothetical protein